MDRRRLLIVLLLAIGLVLIAIVAFAALTGSLDNLIGGPTVTPQPSPTPQEGISVTVAATAAPEQQFVEVVVSLQTVPRGFQMTETEVTTEFRLADEVEANVFTSPGDVVGLFARRDIYQGETLTVDALVPDLKAVGRDEFGPSSLIPPGFVAMAVPMDRLSSVGYALQPGDTIDILISFLLIPVDEQFQSRLPNNITFFLDDVTTMTDAEGNEVTEIDQIAYTLIPYGRFEELPTGDIAHISPSEEEARGVHISYLIQNAKVIEVGHFIPRLPAQPPTPTPDPDAEQTDPDANQAAQEVVNQVNETLNALTQPPYSFTALVALPPQQQIFLKYAIETDSVVDFALRGVNDGELYSVENVSLDYVVERFNVEIPPNFTHIVETVPETFEGFQNTSDVILFLTPEAEEEEEGTENGQ